MSVHPSPELRVPFEAALNEFESRTGTNLVQHQIFSRLVACESIESILEILREQTKPLRTSRGDESTLMKFIKRTVGVLHSLSTKDIVVSGVSSAFPPAKAVFAGIALLLSAIKDVDKSYDTLVDIFGSFESFLRRLDIYTKIPSTPAMTEVIVKILVELLSTISIAIQQVKQGRLKKLGKRLLGENDREVEAILGRLDRLTLEEARLTGTMTLEVVYDLLKNMKMIMDDTLASVLMDDVRRTLVDMQKVASDMNKFRRDKLQGEVRRWLSPPDPSVNHNMARNAHHNGSAEWFIHGNTFSQWKMGTGSLIWVYGKPGSGKTILSSSIIEDITTSCDEGLASIAFFYFDFKDESKKNSRGALSSLLVQLAAQSDAYSEVLSALYSKHGAGSKQPSDDALRKALESMLGIPDQAPIYIVIDALDECPNSVGTPTPRENVLRLVEWLSSLHCSNLWISVTSRPEPDIEAVLQSLVSVTISLHNQPGQNEDITNYIKWFVNSDPKARKWRKEDKELVIEKLSERANGMFRWVFCQLDSLRQCLIPRVRHSLDELPETLDETYERALLDIDKKHWAYAHRLFQCLVVALRPLRVEELAEFLAFEFKDGESPIFQEDCRHENPREAILSTCSSLISVVDKRFGGAIVQFSHFSVKEYLTAARIAEGRVPRYYIPLEPAHILVARACLSILLQLDNKVTKKRRKEFPLVEYAAEYGVEHAKFENALSQTEDMVKRLFDPRSPHFSAWIPICNTNPIRHSRSDYLRPTPLYYAALLNLCGVAEWLVNTRLQNINTWGGSYGTPLHAASATGSLGVAQFLLMCHADGNRASVPGVLLGQGARINAINDEEETPLIVAIKHGPMRTLIEVTSLLLGHGANPNSITEGMSPIYAALSRGRHDVVHLLQRHGADPNSRVGGNNTMLHTTSKKGDLKVAKGLLELGADVNSRDNQDRTPLHVIKRGCDEVALLLLKYGADPDVRDDTGQTTLHVASQERNLKFARQLLKLGISVNSRDNQGRTPLHVIHWESDDVALLLLEHGADPGVRDNDGRTPLHVASRWGKLRFAQRLLELGVGVNSRDNQGRTPLHEILSQSNDVALLLLEHGADPGVLDDKGRTTLHAASQAGIFKLARRLLELGVGVNSRDNQGRTPLHEIPSFCDDVALLLLEHGANPGVRDNAGQTLLHSASRSGTLRFTHRLLKLGVGVNSRDNQGRTPLHVIEWGGEDVALLLLERGADPGVRDDAGRTPLHVASRERKPEFARRLLELGVGVNSRDNQGRTPLHEIPWIGDSVQVALQLLEHGADPDLRDNAGQTSLHVASREGNFKFAWQLLEFGVEVNSRDNQDRTPLHVIGWRGDKVALLLLDHGADPGVRDDTGQTLLHVASREGQLEFARRLLELGVSINSRDNQGRTPLHLIESRSEGVALLLLEHGADPGIQDDAGQTPLYAASRSGNLKFTRRLLELGVGVDSRDNQGSTPLLEILSQSDDVALLLLEHGADPAVRDDNGQTSLHVASRWGGLKFAQRLLELGVGVNSRDNYGRTPLHGIRRENDNVALLLLEHGADTGVRDNAGQTTLHAASRSGSLRFAQRLLELGVGVNCRDNQGRTPLHLIEWESDDVALLLLEHGADPGVRDDAGQTLLHVASREGKLKFSQRLLELGVGVNSRDNQGRTPLHVVQRASDNVALLLLERGADPGVRDDAGQTPLHVASRWGKLEFARRLLEHGVDVNSRDNQSRTPLHVIQSWSKDVALLLLERGADPDVQDDAGQTLLHAASRSGCLEFARRLLQLGASLNSRDNQGRTPLHVIQWASEDVVLLLLERGADPGVRDNVGQTTLHAASREGKLKFARRLLELGVDVNSRDNQGRTPLHVIGRSSDDAALFLLDRGADPGVQDDAGQTPLHAALREGTLKFARRLLELGVSVNSHDNLGRTPLHEIRLSGEDVALLLLEQGADPGVRDDAGQTPLHAASRWGKLKFAQRLLELGAGVNSRDNQGRTPLHLIEWRRQDFALLLLEHGADTSIRDNEGRTPLHAVSRWGKLSVTRRLLELDPNVEKDYHNEIYFDRVLQWCEDVSLLLLKRGADPGVRDNDGQTPLHVASREGNLRVAQQLLKFGVDVNSPDHQGRTPFQLAVEGGHDEVQKVLLDHGAAIL